MVSNRPRSAFVTGGSSGIGCAIANALARDGCDVGIYYQGEAEEAQAATEKIESYGQHAWSKTGDVADSEQTQQAIDEFSEQFGGIDILINNAGIFRDQVIWKMTDQQWQDVINVDLTGVFNCSRAVAPIMRKSGGGAIVNISSINGLRGKFGQTNYSAAKAGVIGLTKALAKELARFDVTVNAVAPGMIQTAILDAMPPQEREEAVKEIILGRIGQPEDVAELVAFLCSNRARFITGEVVRIDGGQYI